MEFVWISVITVGLCFLFGFLAVEVLGFLAKIWEWKENKKNDNQRRDN